MVNNVDPDQTAPLEAVCSGSTLFAQTCLSKNIGTERYNDGKTNLNSTANRHIFAAINFRISLNACHSMTINSFVDLTCLISYYRAFNVCADLFLQNFLPREYCENKSLTKLNRFTEVKSTCCGRMIWQFLLSFSTTLQLYHDNGWWWNPLYNAMLFRLSVWKSARLTVLKHKYLSIECRGTDLMDNYGIHITPG